MKIYHDEHVPNLNLALSDEDLCATDWQIVRGKTKRTATGSLHPSLHTKPWPYDKEYTLVDFGGPIPANAKIIAEWED